MGTNETTHTDEKVPTTAKSGVVGRRAALATVVAAGACGIAAFAGPQIVTDVKQSAESMAHQALAHELQSLESVSLDDAIRAAEITKAAVQVIVLPLAQLVSIIGGDALAVVLASLNTATNVLSSVHINVAALIGLRNMVASWHGNIRSLPISLTSYATANITDAETYLKALKKSTQS